MNRNANYSPGALCIIKSLLVLPFFIPKLFLSSIISVSFPAWLPSFILTLCVNEKPCPAKAWREGMPFLGEACFLSMPLSDFVRSPKAPWQCSQEVGSVVSSEGYELNTLLLHLISSLWNILQPASLWIWEMRATEKRRTVKVERGASQSCFCALHLGQREVTFDCDGKCWFSLNCT